MKHLNIRLVKAISDQRPQDLYNAKNTIKPDAVILIHGGGNVGNLYRKLTDEYLKLVRSFPNQKTIIMPQTINYQGNIEQAESDAKVFGINKDFIISARSRESYEFLKAHYSPTKSIISPDAAFFIGPLEPINESFYDIFILKRIDNEKKYSEKNWNAAIDRHLSFKYSYRTNDWYDYRIDSSNMNSFTNQSVLLMNKMISQGKIIVTDRLHASIFALLIGRPHVIIDEKHKKIYNTREFAFENKSECEQKYTRSYYSTNPDDALRKAVEMLHEYY